MKTITTTQAKELKEINESIAQWLQQVQDNTVRLVVSSLRTKRDSILSHSVKY